MPGSLLPSVCTGRCIYRHVQLAANMNNSDPGGGKAKERTMGESKLTKPSSRLLRAAFPPTALMASSISSGSHSLIARTSRRICLDAMVVCVRRSTLTFCWSSPSQLQAVLCCAVRHADRRTANMSDKMLTDDALDASCDNLALKALSHCADLRLPEHQART